MLFQTKLTLILLLFFAISGCASNPNYHYSIVYSGSIKHKSEIITKESYVVSQKELRKGKTIDLFPKRMIESKSITLSMFEVFEKKIKPGENGHPDKHFLNMIIYSPEQYNGEIPFTVERGLNLKDVDDHIEVWGSDGCLPHQNQCKPTIFDVETDARYFAYTERDATKYLKEAKIKTRTQLFDQIAKLCVLGRTEFFPYTEVKTSLTWADEVSLSENDIKTPKWVEHSLESVSGNLVLRLRSNHPDKAFTLGAFDVSKRWADLRDEYVRQRDLVIALKGQTRYVSYYDGSLFKQRLNQLHNEQASWTN